VKTVSVGMLSDKGRASAAVPPLSNPSPPYPNWAVELKTNGAEWEPFDEVCVCQHRMTHLALWLADPSTAERAALGAVKYQPKRCGAALRDCIVNAKLRKTWASWIYG